MLSFRLLKLYFSFSIFSKFLRQFSVFLQDKLNLMRNLFIFICLITISFSCQKEVSKSNFIGNWSTIQYIGNQIDIQFFKDSMVIDNSIMYGIYSEKWEINDSRIEMTLIRGDKSVLNKKNTIDYKFSATKDTLYIKNEKDSIFYLKLVKIKNGYEAFENKIGLKLDLPKTDKKLTSVYNNENGDEIYIAYQNDSLIVKSNLRQDLLQIRNYVYRFQRNKNKDSINYILFADKSISNKQLDSIKKSINISVDYFPLKYIRIYQHQSYSSTDWKEEIKWYGIYE